MPAGKILIIRLDNIGDVLLSGPAIAVTKRIFPAAHVAALVRSQTMRVLEGHTGLDEIIEDDGNFIRTLARVRRGKFDIAVALWPSARTVMLAMLAGIPKRIGPLSNAWAMLLTHRVEQSRWWARMHESIYNIRLLEPLWKESAAAMSPGNMPKNPADPGYPPPKFSIRADERAAAAEYLRRRSMNESGRLAVIHPGGRWSARLWPARYFGELAKYFIEQRGMRVIITGNSAEQRLMETVREAAGTGCMMLDEPVTLGVLAAIIDRCEILASNSTGPLHIAAALGKPTVAFYCPIKPTSPVRWGPIGEFHAVFRPRMPECRKCIGERCPYFDCMELIKPENVISAMEKNPAGPNRAGRG